MRIFFLLLAVTTVINAQEKDNPIIFADFSFGYSAGGTKGFTGVMGLNYQRNTSLYTFRYKMVEDTEVSGYFPVIPFPIINLEERIHEFGLLYGKRYTYEGMGWSFSAGPGIINRYQLIVNDDSAHYERSHHFAVPFEVNIKWFKRKKSPYRIYEIIPVGKPTAFGNSIGFKLSGTISSTSYIGAGVVFGFGWHKKYQ